MTKLKDALPTSFLGFRVWLDQLICETSQLVPAWISQEDAEQLPLTDVERAEHLPFHQIRRRELVELSRETIIAEMKDAGFTPAQLRHPNAECYLTRATRRDVAAWAMVQNRAPSDRSRQTWAAASIYLAFGNGNRSEAARICNLGISRTDQSCGVADEAIRNALHSIVRRTSPITSTFRYRLRIEVCETIAARQLWDDLAAGVPSVSGRRRLETAATRRRSGDLYVKFFERLSEASIDASLLDQHVYELAKIALALLEHRTHAAAPSLPPKHQRERTASPLGT